MRPMRSFRNRLRSAVLAVPLAAACASTAAPGQGSSGGSTGTAGPGGPCAACDPVNDLCYAGAAKPCERACGCGQIGCSGAERSWTNDGGVGMDDAGLIDHATCGELCASVANSDVAPM